MRKWIEKLAAAFRRPAANRDSGPGSDGKSTAAERFTERDNLGTRYETQERVDAFWMPYVLRRPDFPYVFYDFASEQDARTAMLSLGPIRIAADSGKLICTEVLGFGVYPSGSEWGFFLAGPRITPELYAAAVSACERCHGKHPRVSDPPNAPTPAVVPASRTMGAVTFEREERVDMLAQMKARGITVSGAASAGPRFAIKRHYRGPGRETALAFLKESRVDEPFRYVIVHTPEGVFGRDKDGIYEQPD